MILKSLELIFSIYVEYLQVSTQWARAAEDWLKLPPLC